MVRGGRFGDSWGVNWCAEWGKIFRNKTKIILWVVSRHAGWFCAKEQAARGRGQAGALPGASSIGSAPPSPHSVIYIFISGSHTYPDVYVTADKICFIPLVNTERVLVLYSSANEHTPLTFKH